LVAIRKRIELFHEVTEPVIEYYRQKGQLVEINGENSIEQITEEIIGSIK
jgi:adenylate kinase